MKKILNVIALAAAVQTAVAQERVITTGVPFLLIAADARSAGMGDMGVATTADAFSQQYNPAKFAFAGSLRYFGLGDIQLTDNTGTPQYVVSPNEMAFDGSYSLKLSERFSMAVAGRFIRSSLRIADAVSDASAATSFAVDVAGFYQSEEISFSDFMGRYRLGFNFQNMGPKINYNNDGMDENANFLPSNLRLGGSFDFIFDQYNTVSVSAEITKLLVPTPPAAITPVDSNGNGVIDQEEKDTADDAYSLVLRNYYRQGWSSGIFKSFNDAPGGFSEELKEFTWALGTEYTYQDAFALRLGYFHESEMKGARKFLSLGAGFKYNIVRIDVSYLFSASKVRNPLENTLRFSLTFNFGEKYGL